jgi:hypothetical protein
MWPFTAVRYLLFVVRFFARRAKKRTTDEIGRTIAATGKAFERDRVSPVNAT